MSRLATIVAEFRDYSRRKRRQFVAAEFGNCCRKRQLSPNSATVAEIGDYSRQCGQGFSSLSCPVCLTIVNPTTQHHKRLFFSARCTMMHSAVLRSHVVRPSVHLTICPSVRPSVTFVDQDHMGWKSWKLSARTISPTISLFVVQRPST